eukprot:superscaffoldBa00003324_g16666
MIQRPIFLLAGKLAQSLGLKQPRPVAAATHLPVVQLNFTAVSQETPFSRDVVEGCVRETLLLLVRALASEQIVTLPLQGIGILSFKNNKVRMKFNRDFINAMDGSGRLHLAFNNRPGSSASLMSGGLSRLQRPQTANHIALPTVCSPQPDNKAGDKEGWPSTISPPEVTPKLEEPHVNVGCSGHARAGQAKLHEHREHAKQVAAFNLQMSEKKEKTYCPLYPTSFIFPARPLTPARRMKQNRYMNELQSQIESQRQHKAQDQQNCLLMEHLDQVQLVQEIALQKAQQLQQKQEKTKHYKKALDTQARKAIITSDHVEDKKVTDLPEFQPDKSGFSRCETPAANAESRERAQKRKKEELHNRQVQLEKEREMLKHNQMELILDRINRFEKKRNISKSLESEWSLSATLKHQREEEERRFLRSAGQLLVDKLAQYRRCCQCKRRTSNSGETNIWKDSHYLSGSQFMI